MLLIHIQQQPEVNLFMMLDLCDTIAHTLNRHINVSQPNCFYQPINGIGILTIVLIIWKTTVRWMQSITLANLKGTSVLSIEEETDVVSFTAWL